MTRVQSAGARGGVALIAAVALIAGAAPLRFETVFATAGEPATLHFRATFVSHGAPHVVEVWRDHDRRVERITDARVTSYVVHAPGSADFDMTMVDPAKRVITTIDRTNLYRLGNFLDWFDLGHGLRHPKGSYTLTAGRAPSGRAGPGAAPAIAPCAWYDLTVAGRTTHVCWAATVRLPLAIVAADGVAVWRVTAIDHAPPADAFRVVDRGYVRIDANRDISGD